MIDTDERQFPLSTAMTVLYAVVIAVATFLATIAAWIAVVLGGLLFSPVKDLPHTSEGLSAFFTQSLGEHFAFLSAVQGLSVLALVYLFTRPKDGFTRTRALRLERISVRTCALWVIGGLVTILVFGQVPSLFVDLGERQAIAWLDVLKPVWIGVVVLVVIAPLSEEVLFRGYLYGGLAQSAIGPVGAILVTSSIWAVAHLQYTWLIIAVIFMYGVVFGIMRWKSGSLWPPIVAHCVVNLISGVVYYSGVAGA